MGQLICCYRHTGLQGDVKAGPGKAIEIPVLRDSLTLDFQSLLNHGILLSIYLYSCLNEQINNYTAH